MTYMHYTQHGVWRYWGRCYLHQQQYGSSCSGRTNIGEHFILSCTSATHQQRFRADVFQIPQQRQARPEQALEVLQQHGVQVTLEQARMILEFLRKLADIAVTQYLNR